VNENIPVPATNDGSVESSWTRLSTKIEGQSWPAPALYVVATPIGNLGDLTLRAAQALTFADVIAAEDTRATKVLLDAWGIATPLMSAHRHNEALAAESIVERLTAGQRVALVCDAGSPAVSDPGARVVAQTVAAGFRVIPLPGPSALLAALMSAGVTTDEHPEFVFAGFAPSKSAARLKWFKCWCAMPAALVYYEAPHRIVASLRDLLDAAGSVRRVTLARELTKRFEQIVTLPLSEANAWVQADAHREQGEYVVVLHHAEKLNAQDVLEANATLDAWLDALLPSMSVRDVARVAAQATGLSRDVIYTRALARKPD